MKVLVTRPNKAGKQLVSLLKARNISAEHYSPIEIVEGRELTLLPNILSSLDSNDYVFFVSKNAVYFTEQMLTKNQCKWRDDLNYFAIGKATARYFSEVSQQAIRYPVKFANSENLLQMPEMQESNINGKNFLILRAETGRDLILQTIQKRGARVKTLESYQRKIKNDINVKMSFFKALRIDTLIITSCDILLALFEYSSQQDKNWLKQCLLIVVSERIKELAIKLGWQKSNLIISPDVNNHSLLDTVIINQY